MPGSGPNGAYDTLNYNNDRCAVRAQIGLVGDPMTSAFRAVQSGVSFAMTLNSDSTGDEPNDFFLRTRSRLAAALPGARVVYRTWNNGTTKMNAEVVVAAGTIQQGGIAGEECIVFDWTNGAERSRFLPSNEMPAFTSADLEVVAKIRPVALATGAYQHVMSNYVGVSDRGVEFGLSPTGAIWLAWAPTASTTLNAISTATLASAGITDGQDVAIRAVLDVDNGSGIYTVTLYYNAAGSVDGPWTQLGGVILGAATTSWVRSSGTFNIGAQTATGTPFSGRIYNAIWKDGIDGKIISPWFITDYRRRSPTDPNFIGGSPTLILHCAGQTGSAVAYWTQTRLDAAIYPYGRRQVILTWLGHNESLFMGEDVITSFAAYIARLGIRAPNSPIVIGIQNLTTAPWNVYEDSVRAAQYEDWAWLNKYPTFSARQTFLNYAAKYGSYVDLLDNPSVTAGGGPHPTHEGFPLAPQPYGSEVIALDLLSRIVG